MADVLQPFADDKGGMTIGDMTVENGTDRVSLLGSLDIAKDWRGLVQAKALRAVLDGVIAALEAEKTLWRGPRRRSRSRRRGSRTRSRDDQISAR